MRRFRYYADPEEVREYLEKQGYHIKVDYSRDGKHAIGFTVEDTTVDLSYDISIGERMVGYGMISLRDSVLIQDPKNPHNTLVDSNPKRYDESLRLYQKLYRRFRKPKDG